MVRKMAAGFTSIMAFFMFMAMMPAPVHCRESGMEKFDAQRKYMFSELNLSPDKAKAFMSVGEHWDQVRQNLIAGIRENEKDLEKALAEPSPDEGKIIQLVNALITTQDQLFETFKSQRQEEMALLNPVQRGKFILTLKKWHENGLNQQ